MVIKKIKESDQALSKNNGESVKYRIRKQQEKEANELLKQSIDEDEDVLDGDPVEVPGTD